MQPASKSRVMTTVDASQVDALSLCKGRIGLLIRETCTPPSAAGVGWEGVTVTVDESPPCSCVKFIVGLSLCSTQLSFVVS